MKDRLTEIADLVREIMGDTKQNKFARILEVDQTSISAILNCRRPPSIDVAKKLANYSGLPLEKFIK